MGRSICSRRLTLDRIQHPTNANGGKPVTASTAPFRIAGACSVLSCRIESCSGARCLSLPPWRF